MKQVLEVDVVYSTSAPQSDEGTNQTGSFNYTRLLPGVVFYSPQSILLYNRTSLLAMS